MCSGACLCVCVHVSVYAFVLVCLCVRVCMCMCTCMCMSVHVLVFVRACVSSWPHGVPGGVFIGASTSVCMRLFCVGVVCGAQTSGQVWRVLPLSSRRLMPLPLPCACPHLFVRASGDGPAVALCMRCMTQRARAVVLLCAGLC